MRTRLPIKKYENETRLIRVVTDKNFTIGSMN